MSTEKIKDLMEEKIVLAFKDVASSAFATDLSCIAESRFDPKLTEKFDHFVELLCECGEKRLYNSRENALKRIKDTYLK